MMRSPQSAPVIDCARVRDSYEAPYAGGQTGSPGGAGREFSVAWIDDEYFVTADEGDLDGGSRSFTISKKDGTVMYSSGNELELLAARLGHYPEHRSENKGTEPEKIEGMAVMDNGDVYVCNDNDGVDDNSGETQLLNVGGTL